MSTEYPDIAAKLNESIPWEEITYRSAGSGRWLAYVSGEYVKRQLSEIFGWEKWSYDVDNIQFNSTGGVEVKVRLTIEVGNEPWKCVDRVGLAYGTNVQGLDFAAASGVTDALKRAAATLGNRLGLQLYRQRSPAFNAAWRAIEQGRDVRDPIGNSKILSDYEKVFLLHFYEYLQEQ